MLTNLYLENFKTWAEVDVEFRGLTGLFGANSSGKSSIIQFLLLLKQTKEATDRTISLDFNGKFARLGAVTDALHNHDPDLTLTWKLDFELDDDLVIQDPSNKRTAFLVKSNQFSISSSVENSSLGAVGTKLQYWVGKTEFSLERKRGDKNAFDLKAKGLDFKFIRTPGRAWQLPSPNKSYAFPDQARTYYQNASLLADLEATYEKEIDNIYYLGPLREPPKREYVWGKTRPLDVGLKGELVIDAILAASADKRQYNLVHRGRLKSFQEIVAHWLQEMGLIQNFEIKEIAQGTGYYQAWVRTRKNSPPVLLTDVGFGISQVLPIIVLLYYVPENSTVIFEQPEIHLHPLAQSALADLFINVWHRRGVQIVFESHSEHLLLRMQRRIAEEELDDDDIIMHSAAFDSRGSKLDQLEINELGQIANWPSHFMGDAFGETLAAEKARLKRLMK
jgi:predicted ATPase